MTRMLNNPRYEQVWEFSNDMRSKKHTRRMTTLLLMALVAIVMLMWQKPPSHAKESAFINRKLAEGLLHPTLSPNGQYVVYSCCHHERHDGLQIFKVPITGESLPSVIDDRLPAIGAISEFGFTADSKYFVLVADSGIFVLPMSGGRAIDLTSGIPGTVNGLSFAISPDSSHIVYSTARSLETFEGEDSDIYSYSIADRKTIQLYGEEDYDCCVGRIYISSDSKHVVFVSSKERGPYENDLYSTPIDGGAVIKLNPILPENGQKVTGHRISQDARYIVYIMKSDAESPEKLYSVLVDGGPSIDLTEPLGSEVRIPQYFAVSPNSRRVVFIAGPNYGLYSTSITGGEVTKLTGEFLTPTSRIVEFAISPDSSRVIYEADERIPGREELFSVPIDGGTSVRLNGEFNSKGDISGFAVSPESRYVIYKADQEINGVEELYSVPISGGIAKKISHLLGTADFITQFMISSDSRRVIYSTRYGGLYNVPFHGGTVTKLNVPLAEGDAVVIWAISQDSRSVIYSVEQLLIEPYGHRVLYANYDDSSPGPPPSCENGLWGAEYFDNATLIGDPVVTRCERDIDHYWGSASPIAGVPEDYFSARWTQRVNFPKGGTYRFRGFTGDTIRMEFDGKPYMTGPSPSPFGEETVLVEDIPTGEHEIKVEFAEYDKNAMVDFNWYRCSNGAGDCNPSIPSQYQTWDMYADIPMPEGCTTVRKQSLAAYGCLVTSISMALSNYGVFTTPHELNKWLTENEGYTDPCAGYLKQDEEVGGLFWPSIIKFAEQPEYGGVRLKWKSTSDAAQTIRKGHPVILRVPGTNDGHWLLATDVAETHGQKTLGINDPHHSYQCWVDEAGDVPPYSQIFCGQGRLKLLHATTQLEEDAYKGSSYPVAYLDRESNALTDRDSLAFTPSLQLYAKGAELILVDKSGARVGYDQNTGQIVSEIPGSFYFDSEIVPHGSEPSGEIYRTLLIAENAGKEYSVRISSPTSLHSTESQEIVIMAVGADREFKKSKDTLNISVGSGSSIEIKLLFEPGESITFVPPEPTDTRIYLPLSLGE